jgi:hypothetical protein
MRDAENACKRMAGVRDIQEPFAVEHTRLIPANREYHARDDGESALPWPSARTSMRGRSRAELGDLGSAVPVFGGACIWRLPPRYERAFHCCAEDDPPSVAFIILNDNRPSLGTLRRAWH